MSNARSVQIVDDGLGNITLYDKSLPGSDPGFMRTFDGITNLQVTGTQGADNISASLVGVNSVFNGGPGSDAFPVSVVDVTDDVGNLLIRGSANVVVNGGSGADVFSGNNFGTGTFAFNGDAGKDSLNPLGVVGYNVAITL